MRKYLVLAALGFFALSPFFLKAQMIESQTRTLWGHGWGNGANQSMGCMDARRDASNDLRRQCQSIAAGHPYQLYGEGDTSCFCRPNGSNYFNCDLSAYATCSWD
jgi:hypothetical protein